MARQISSGAVMIRSFESLNRKTHNSVPAIAPRAAVQRAARTTAALEIAPDSVRDALGRPGQPLDAATRAFMEPRFGHDFSSVRVHADTKAAESAQAVNALAYTMGRDVVFGAGQYAPAIASGRQLLAHELAHVVQQAGARQADAGRDDDQPARRRL